MIDVRPTLCMLQGDARAKRGQEQDDIHNNVCFYFELSLSCFLLYFITVHFLLMKLFFVRFLVGIRDHVKLKKSAELQKFPQLLWHPSLFQIFQLRWSLKILNLFLCLSWIKFFTFSIRYSSLNIPSFSNLSTICIHWKNKNFKINWNDMY